jgi:glycine cleavage system aminomethyltransferase T
VSLAFLTPATGPGAPPAESPIAHPGATCEVRDGWLVATSFGDPRAEEAACRESVGWADVSHLRKLELQGDPDRLSALAGGLRMGEAVRHEDAWWCLVTPTRVLVIGDADLPGSIDVTTQHSAMRITGPAARETFARFCALDLRPHRAPARSFLPGSVARTPGYLLVEEPDRYLVVVGAALGTYLWSVVADAGGALGGRAVGVDHA